MHTFCLWCLSLFGLYIQDITFRWLGSLVIHIPVKNTSKHGCLTVCCLWRHLIFNVALVTTTTGNLMKIRLAEVFALLKANFTLSIWLIHLIANNGRVTANIEHILHFVRRRVITATTGLLGSGHCDGRKFHKSRTSVYWRCVTDEPI